MSAEHCRRWRAHRYHVHRYKDDFERTAMLLNELQAEVGYGSVIADSNVVKVSVIGVGMRSHAGVAQLMFKTLSERVSTCR